MKKYIKITDLILQGAGDIIKTSKVNSYQSKNYKFPSKMKRPFRNAYLKGFCHF